MSQLANRVGLEILYQKREWMWTNSGHVFRILKFPNFVDVPVVVPAVSFRLVIMRKNVDKRHALVLLRKAVWRIIFPPNLVGDSLAIRTRVFRPRRVEKIKAWLPVTQRTPTGVGGMRSEIDPGLFAESDVKDAEMSAPTPGPLFSIRANTTGCWLARIVVLMGNGPVKRIAGNLETHGGT